MGGFTKFDPRAFLRSEEPRSSHANSAKPAKTTNQPDQALAGLATLAATRADSQNRVLPVRDGPATELLAPLFTQAPLAESEPGFCEPCVARRGRVEARDGLFLHFCAECGAWGAFGYGVNLRADQLGRWYCAAHRPQGAADVESRVK
jgi:hypothetical protein